MYCFGSSECPGHNKEKTTSLHLRLDPLPHNAFMLAEVNVSICRLDMKETEQPYKLRGRTSDSNKEART
eukprot:5117065-Karenia_brevis.AAC.1